MGRRPSWGEPLEGVPPQAEAALHAIDEDEGRKGAERAFGLVVATCEVTDPRGGGLSGQGPGCASGV